jgi:iron complex outermembrane receptor protein
VGGLEATYQRFYEKSLDLAFGLRGSFADRFDWDATFGRAEYRAERTRPRFDGSAVSDFFYGPRLAGTGTPRYNINLDRFYRPITPEEYRAMSTTLRYEADSYANQANFVLSGDLFDMPAGPVGFAGVLEWTSQGYDLNSPEGILPTNRTVYNLTGTNGGGERDRYALGTEFRIPLLESLTATIAGRFDKYDDITAVDDAKTYGAGLEWRPLDSLLVRGQYSTSFKAPDMHFVFNEGSGGFSTNTDFFRCLSTGGTVGQSSCAGATYAYSVFATSQGEPTLKEERRYFLERRSGVGLLGQHVDQRRLLRHRAGRRRHHAQHCLHPGSRRWLPHRPDPQSPALCVLGRFGLLSGNPQPRDPHRGAG